MQAHSAGIERMRISYDNKFLFTAGKDGCLYVHSVAYWDPRGGDRATGRENVQFSDEILTEKQEMVEITNQKEQLHADLQQAQDPSHSGVNEKSSTNDQEEKIKKLHEQLSSQQLMIRSKIEQLEATKSEIQEKFQKELKLQAEENQQELEARRNEYSQRMLEDAARYQTLQDQQQQEARKFRDAQAAIYEDHTAQVNKKQREHKETIQKEQDQIDHLRQNIKTMQDDNKETMKQINDDAEEEIREIQQKNQNSLNQVTDMALRSKADLQITKNKLADVHSEIKTLSRWIIDRTSQLENQRELIQQLNHKWTQQKSEIENKDNVIAMKEKNILYLKKKTQELEKFKFVLDYKIKDLRKEIAPKELEIVNLRNRTRSMDQKLKKYNSVNAQLGFMVEDLRVRSVAIQKLIEKNREIIRNNETYIRSFKNAVYQVVQYIDDHQQLKIAVNKSLYGFMKNQEAKNGDVNPHIKQEYENQTKFLDNSIHSLRKRLEIESQIHKADNMQIMMDNIELIDRIGQLRKRVRDLERKKTIRMNQLKDLKSKYGIKEPSGELAEKTSKD